MAQRPEYDPKAFEDARARQTTDRAKAFIDVEHAHVLIQQLMLPMPHSPLEDIGASTPTPNLIIANNLLSTLVSNMLHLGYTRTVLKLGMEAASPISPKTRQLFDGLASADKDLMLHVSQAVFAVAKKSREHLKSSQRKELLVGVEPEVVEKAVALLDRAIPIIEKDLQTVIQNRRRGG